MDKGLETIGEAAKVYVAAFGKHPGWDDHIDDIGVETARLVTFKRMLYMNGIGGNIDAGAWENLDEHQRIPDFHHLFLYVEPGAAIIGKFWSSSDGKGRKRYPMVVCAQCPGTTLPWLLEELPPRLTALEEICRNESSAEAVQTAVARTRRELAAAVAAALDGGTAIPGWFMSTDVAERLCELGDRGYGFKRVLYKIEREMGSHADPAAYTKGDPPQPQHLRVPLNRSDGGPTLALWVGVMHTVLSPRPPLFLAQHLERDWLDIIVGTPRPQQLFCLRASRQGLPSATDIPYNLDEDFNRHADEMLASWRDGASEMRRHIMEAGLSDENDAAGSVKGLFGKVRSLFGGR